MRFLRQVVGNMAKRQWYRNFRRVAANSVLKEEGNERLRAYIDKSQTTVMDWVLLIPIYKVCDREVGYEGGGRRRDPWWQQTAARKQLRVTLEEILVAARTQQPEFRRCGEGGEWAEVAESEPGSEEFWYSRV